MKPTFYLLAFFFSFVASKAIAQVPIKYETRVISMPQQDQPNMFGAGPTAASSTRFQDEVNKQNAEGFRLTTINFFNFQQQGATYVLIFERSNSYREAELYALINEINSNIDKVATDYIDKAKADIQNKLLDYLKDIPKNVLTDEYEKNFSSKITAEIDRKVREAFENAKKEVRGAAYKK
jgi:hypothetical protein